MKGAIVQIAAHALLFILAVFVFYIGLGVGLAFNPRLGHASVGGRCRLGRVEPILDLPVAALTGNVGISDLG